jgi:ABC-type branched-subunit amino acid transport system substrate-binding protein
MPQPPVAQAKPAPAPAAPSPQVATPRAPVQSTQLPDGVLAAPPVQAPVQSPAVAALPPVPVPPKADKATVRAALLLPMTGKFAGLGQALANASQLALFEVADQHFQLLPFDTKGSAEGAAAAAGQALAQGADVILGPVFSAEVKAVAPVARERNIPVLSFTTDRSAAGNGAYALGFLPGPQVERVVAFARSQGKEKFGLLFRNDDYGRAVADAFRAAVPAQGGQVVKTELYDPNTQDFSRLVSRFAEFDSRKGALAREKARLATRSDAGSQDQLKQLDKAQVLGDAPFDAVMIADDGTRLRNIAGQLSFFEVDMARVKLLGTLLWDEPSLWADPALQGAWYAAPPGQAHQEFEARYAKAFGQMPARTGQLASIAYDATALAAALARAGQGDYPAQALTNPNGFAGADGLFRLLPDGTADRGLAVREISKDGAKEIAPAPASFAVVGQ